MDSAAARVNELYARYHRAEYIHPDPLEFLHLYPAVEDREITGMIASCFALGRVELILKSVGGVLKTMGAPRKFLENHTEKDFLEMFRGFTYRFFRREHIVSFLCSLKQCIAEFGSLETCFYSGVRSGEETYIPALSRFIEYLSSRGGGKQGMLLCSPEKGSACKRHMLFLRWMIRSDQVDPGGWNALSPSRLIVPVDTHMLSMSRHLGFTRRNQADLKAAVEITGALKNMCPEDPVRYDFSMTRPGIRREN